MRPHDDTALLAEDWRSLQSAVATLLRHPFRVAVIALTVASAVYVRTMWGQPVYRTQAKVQVVDASQKRPQLENQKVPRGIADGDEALGHLKSRSLVEELVAGPPDGALPTPERDDSALRLGLETWVTDTTAAPLRAALHALQTRRSSDLRLFARVLSRERGAPGRIEARLIDAGRIELAAEGDAASCDVFEVNPEQVIEFRGVRLRVDYRGEWDARTWLIEHLTVDDAVSRVLRSLRVDKQQHQEGTLGITCLDSDAHRAAAIANALAENLIARDLLETRTLARESAEFLTRELETRRAELTAAEKLIESIRTRAPDVVDDRATAASLVARQGVWETRHGEARQLRAQAEAVVLELLGGNRAAVARSAAALDDPTVSRLLSDVAAHRSERLRVERGDQGEYRRTLLVIADRYTVEVERAEEELLELQQLLQATEVDARTGAARLSAAASGAAPLSPAVETWIAELERACAELEELRAEWTDEYEGVARLRAEVDERLARVADGLRGQIAALETRLARRRSYASRWAGLYEDYPEREADVIDAALDQLWTEIDDALVARVEGLRAEERAAEAEAESTRDRLRRLAEAKSEIAGPELERDQLRAVVAGLIRDVETAEVAAAGVEPGVRMLDVAIVPTGRLKPVGTFSLIVGSALGLIVAVAATLVSARALGGGESDEELEHAAGLPVIGDVSSPATGARGAGRAFLPLLDDPGGPAASALRELRTRVGMLTREGQQVEVLGLVGDQDVDCAAAALGLAQSRAQSGERVCLVEADLRSPQVLLDLGLEPCAGLAESLDGRRHWRQCVVDGGIEGLRVLGAGDPFDDPADLFTGAALRRLLSDLRAHHDLVVVSLPPRSRPAELEAIAGELDAVLLLHAAGREARGPDVARFAERLRRVGARPVGVVRAASARRPQAAA